MILSNTSTDILGFGIGAAFGAFLLLAGLADPDKIIGTLRLKDFHAMRTIAVFVLVGIVGGWVLQQAGVANMSVKTAAIWTVLLGGALLGVGFGLTGYCPGTGLACAAAGRIDALVTVIGMFLGALAYIVVHPWLVVPMEKVANYGKVTIPQITKTDTAWWALPIGAAGALLLWLTRPRHKTPA